MSDPANETRANATSPSPLSTLWRGAGGEVHYIFLDDGGVLNDNSLRGPEWQRLVGEFLTPRLGGAPEAWAAANRDVFEGSWQRYVAWLERDGHAAFGDTAFWREERPRWLREMCAYVGVPAPEGDACATLATETERYVTPRVRAAYPGAADAVRRLRGHGYELGTASGETSEELTGYLTGLGVLDCFTLPLFGPDVALAPKLARDNRYYRAIFERAGVDPQRSLVVDNEPEKLALAASCGARTALIGDVTCPADIAAPSLAALAQSLVA